MFVPRGKRIRDVREGPDGLVYVLTDEENGELLRIRPRTSGATRRANQS